MTHQEQSSVFEDLLQVLTDHGFEGMSQAIEILMNEAMKLERAEVLGAQPYERKEGRRGYANGYKPKTVNSRLGRLNLQVPQTRDVSFYPSALERGERSERALKLAVAEMYVQCNGPQKLDSPIRYKMPASATLQEVQEMSRKRRVFGAAFKAKVALAALRGDKTTAARRPSGGS